MSTRSPEEVWLELADYPIKECRFCGELFELDEDGHCQHCAAWLKEQEDIEKRRRIEAKVEAAMRGEHDDLLQEEP